MTPLVSVPKNPKKISGEFPLRGDTPQPGIAGPAPSARGFSTIRCVGEPRPSTAFPSPQQVSAIHSHPTASSSASAIQASLRARMAKGIHPSTSFRAHRHGGVPNREESYQDRDPSRSWYPRRRHWDIEDPGEPEIHCEIALRICVMSMSYTHESYVDERWR